MAYNESDLLIEAFVSDLLYQGYSLYYLYEWYSEHIRDAYLYTAIENKCLDEYIKRLEELDGEKHKYEIIIPYGIKSKSQKEIAEQLLKKTFYYKNKKRISVNLQKNGNGQKIRMRLKCMKQPIIIKQ